MEANRIAFKKNQHINPETQRKIKINGPTHKKLVKKYLTTLPKVSPKVLAKKVLPKVSPNKRQKYKIMDNCGISFIVFINKNTVNIHKNIYNMDTDKSSMEKKPILTYKTEKIWIGKSPKNEMTTFSRGYGPKFDGNSILLKLKDKYIYIGSEIYSFVPLAPIKTYISPVGNSGVPYPYAIDTGNNYYFMIEYNILLNTTIHGDPYSEYYAITKEGKGKVVYKGTEFDMYNYPSSDYAEDYDRLIKNKWSTSFTDTKGKKYFFNKLEYVHFMKEFARQNKIQYLKHTILVESWLDSYLNNK